MQSRSGTRSLFPIAVFSFVVSLALAQSCQSRVGDPFDHELHFEIKGLHVPVTCDGCHGEHGYDNTPSTCEGCHEGDRPDNHYEGNCAECHTEYGFLGQTGDDAEPPHPCMTNHDECMPLILSHLGPYCKDCHPNAAQFDYKGLDSGACSNCHEAERPDLDHYPGQDCMPCHLPNKWNTGREHGITFGNLYYLIDIAHPGIEDYPDQPPAECSDCHPASPKAYTPYTCMNDACHSPQAAVEAQHQVTITYTPAGCMSCHVTELN